MTSREEHHVQHGAEESQGTDGRAGRRGPLRSEVGQFSRNNGLAVRADDDASAARQHRREVDLHSQQADGSQLRQNLSALRTSRRTLETVGGVASGERLVERRFLAGRR